LLVVRQIERLFIGLDHEDNVAGFIQPVERADLAGELISENEAEGFHRADPYFSLGAYLILFDTYAGSLWFRGLTRGQNDEEGRSSAESLRNMQSPLRMAEEMGKGLG
jgi:hypothetical protein